MAIYPANARAYLETVAQEDPIMFTHRRHDRFTTLVFAGLAVVATMVVATLGYAVANIQIVA